MSGAVTLYQPKPRTEVKLFTFAPTAGVEFRIRTLWVEGAPWFVAEDVCRALGMNMRAGATQWIVALAPEERRLVIRRDLPEIFSGTSAPSATLISESGLYKLIMRSTKPEARLFQDWVTRDVLVSIRKDGMYVLGEEKVATGEVSEEACSRKAAEERRADNAAHRPFRNYVVCGMMRQIVGAAHDARAFPSVGRAGWPMDRSLRHSVLAASGATMG